MNRSFSIKHFLSCNIEFSTIQYQKFFIAFLILPFLFSPPISAQQTCGVFTNDSTANIGYTLFSNNEHTYLIDNCGLIVNEWVSDYKPGESVYLLENGNLLRTAKIESDFGLGGAGGRGGRLELFSWENELLWFFEIANSDLHLHHDIEPLPNGNILVIAWEKQSAADAQLMGRLSDTEVWSERIMELAIKENNQAEIVWQWRLWDHLVQHQNPALSNYGGITDNPQLIDINYTDTANKKNWVHINSIDYHPELDQILVSSRLFNEVWIIDHGTSTTEAASHSGGQYNKGGDLLYRFGNPRAYKAGGTEDQIFQHQHDARWITSGYPHLDKLMVFNNDHSPSFSSVEIWQPLASSPGTYQMDGNTFQPMETEWSYTKQGFYSEYMGSAHFLPNGNLFICEATEGYFFEVDSNQYTVWDYINPVNKNGGAAIQGGTVRFNDTFRANKYPYTYKAFDGKDLTPGLPVELSPWETDCFVPTPFEHKEIEITLLGNPIYDQLVFYASSENLSLSIYNSKAQLVWTGPVNIDLNHHDFSNLPIGLYVLNFRDDKGFKLPLKVLKF